MKEGFDKALLQLSYQSPSSHT